MFQFMPRNKNRVCSHWDRLFPPSTGAVQSSIGCLCQNTRVAAAIAAPLSTSSPSAATTTNGKGRPAALNSHWLLRHSLTHPTGPSAWVALWERPCQLRGWRGVQSSHAVSVVMGDPWTPRGLNLKAILMTCFFFHLDYVETGAP